ncbi:UNVERIFIED_CONTAM: protein NLP7 [Sesamum latifolium]|uniref:Protein NLP7 n=1 Tax=Sesamum latifolium TaxID=2727402 RepID=A0AAW2YFE9_9LAMI
MQVGSSSGSRAPTFSGDAAAFPNWSIKMKRLLFSEGLLNLVEEGYKKPQPAEILGPAEMKELKQDMVNDAKALSLIRSSLSPNIVLRISSATTAKEAWDTIQTMFQNKTIVKEVGSGSEDKVTCLSGDKPFFDMFLMRSAVKPLCQMIFPNRVESLLPSTNLQATVRCSGKIHTMHFYGQRKQKGFGAGWRQFLDHHHLVEGDALVFEVIESNDSELDLNVHILRSALPPQLQQEIKRRTVNVESKVIIKVEDDDDDEVTLNPLNWPDHHLGSELNDILDPEDPLADPVIWAFCNAPGDIPGSSGAGPSGFPGEGCSTHGIHENPVSGDQSLPLPLVSVPRTQYNCICCQVLREITHTNGMNVKRLEIHGRFGVISHAVLGEYDFDSSFQGQEIQMFERVNKGYSTMQDPLSTFYEALCVGLNNECDDPNDFLQSPGPYGDFLNNQQETFKQPECGSSQGGSMKIPLSMQRERTRKLKLKDFVNYFDLPIEDAAQKMNICPTVLKKVCRRNGVLRWPYRKIKSIERKISKKVKILDAGDGGEKARAREDIKKHQQELAKIYEAFNQ